MSLTSHLKNSSSPVHEFFHGRFSNTQEVVREVRREVRSRLAGAEPILSPSPTVRYPYYLIGTAFDYRLRFYFEESPLKKLVAYRGMSVVAVGDARVGVAQPNKGNFADCLARTLAELSPIGRRLPRRQEELLTRYCIVLALYETIYRSGKVPEALLLPSTVPPLTESAVDDLLTIPQQSWVDDLCSLSWAFHDDYGDLLRGAAILNPTFEGSGHVGGADADIIIDGCLIEFKVTTDSAMKELRSWLYQLLGYALLDYSDNYGIREVALYLPRQRTLFRWPLENLISRFSHPAVPHLGASGDEFSTVLANLRAEFRRVAELQQV